MGIRFLPVLLFVYWALNFDAVAQTYGSGQYGFIDDSTDFSLPQFLRAAREPSTDQALQFLKITSPKAFQNFNLIFTPRSLQEGSFEHPRALVWGKSAQSGLTFNNDPNHKGYDVLEAYALTPSPSPHDQYFTFLELRPEAEVNPGKCFRCHYSDPRHIWDPYPFWAGVYGSVDDALINFRGSKDPTPLRSSVVGNIRNRAETEELFFQQIQNEYDQYQNFKQIRGADAKSRYHLLVHRGETPNAPFVEAPRGVGVPIEPNTSLTDRFSTLNAKRLVHLLRRDRQCTDPRKIAVLAAALNCGSNTTPYVQHWEIEIDEEPYVESIATKLHSYIEAFRHLETRGPWQATTPDAYLEKVILYSSLGLEKEDWNLKLTPEEWNYFAGARHMELYFTEELYKDVRDHLANNLPEVGYILKALAPSYDYGNLASKYGSEEYFSASFLEYSVKQKQRACHILSEKFNLDAIGHNQPCDLSAKREGIPNVIKMCDSCHKAGEEGAPIFSLSDPTLLTPDQIEQVKLRTESGANESVRMPPNRNLTHRERAELNRFINSEH